jgi:predicted DsbA family dithiol-disulfide isomerase
MQVDVWSDVVCPWCYIGKRQLEAALASFGHGGEVEVTWRSYELDPRAPARREGDLVDLLAKKYGMSTDQARAANERITGVASDLGLDYRLEQAKPGNSFDAHRLVHLAGAHGLGDAMKERLFEAYFTDGLPIGDTDTLVALGIEVGLPEGEVRDTLAGDAFADDVRADERQAGNLGITGVPFFVVDGTYGISGAQPAEVLVEVLERAWSDAHPLVVTGGPADGTSCSDDGCVA